MVKSSKGFRSRTRGSLTKEARERGLPPITRFLQEFAVGDRVIVRLEASEHGGQPHPRYQGRTCIVLGRVGRAYRLSFLDGGKPKELIANPIHLIRADTSPGEAA
ncbi:MAG TPA: 50S ribosomal protein L21e [Thermoplasmata archaeon]|nr:50S ribosomal protein L21e [Thermoplasmata archaeon]HUJ77525.1 50S ribosomal protein L21e [Thermoplasmata archaeon]